MKYRRQHPISIVESTAKYIGLLIFPILRAVLVLGMTGMNWISYLRGVWFDIVVVVLMLAMGVLKWYMCQYTFYSDGFFCRSGIALRLRTFVPYKKLAVISVEKPFYLRPFGAVRISVNTDGGISSAHDIALLISKKDEEQFKKYCAMPYGADGIRRQYIAKNAMVILLSVITSNTMTGMIYTAAFITGVGRVFGKTAERTVITNITKLAAFFANWVPPIASAIALVIIGGWLVAFVMGILRYMNFSVIRDTGLLKIKNGVLIKREYQTSVQRINLVEMRQSVLMKLCGFYTVLIHVNGYGKNKHEISVLMPAGAARETERSLRLILPEMSVCKRTVKPRKKDLPKFLFIPAVLIICASVAWALIYLLFPQWQSLSLFIGIMLEVPCIWYLVVKIISFFHTGVGERGNSYTLRYTYGYKIKTVSLPKQRIIKFRIRQNPFQRFTGCCDLVAYSYSIGMKRHVIQNIGFDEAKDIIGVNTILPSKEKSLANSFAEG